MRRFDGSARPSLDQLGLLTDAEYARIAITSVAWIVVVGFVCSVIVANRPDSAPGVHVVPVLVVSILGFFGFVALGRWPRLAAVRNASALLAIATVALGGVLFFVGPVFFPWVAVMFVWVAASFPVVTRRVGLLHVGFAFGVVGVVIAAQRGHWDALVEWEIIVGGIGVEVGTVEWLVSRITSLALDDRATREELELAADRLGELNRQKREFLAATSHELRTPLNAIIGFAEVLGEQLFGSLNERQADYVSEIRASGRHLLGLIGHALDLAKVESGDVELDVGDVDMAALLVGVAGLFREQAGRRRVELTTDIGDVGTIQGDDGKLRQVVVNLLGNAVKFTPEGGTVRLRAHDRGDRVTVEFSDSGPGIAPEDHERIFEAYEQVPSGAGTGTGLGLAVSRRLVAAHGGELHVVSALGGGSTYTLSLPRRAGKPAAPAPVEARSSDTFDAFDTAEARRRNTRVVTTASLSGVVIGLVVLFTLAVQGRMDLPGFRLGPLLLLAIPAVATGLALRLRPTALDAPRFVATYFLFVAIVTGAIWLAGPLLGAAMACWYIWGALPLFMLLPRREASVLVGVSGAALAAVLALQPGYPLPVVRWLLVMSACAGAGFLVASLADKLRALEHAERQARADVERSWRELERLSRHKSEFLASMSHELRTPLNAVIGFAEVLREELFGSLNPKQAEYIDDIVAAGHQLLALIDDILDLAKAEAGRIELIIRDVAMVDLLRAAIDGHRAEASQRGLQFDIGVEPDAALVRADSVRLGRAVANLVSNAVKFSPDGARIDLQAVRENGAVVVAVHDAGPGIAPADQARIFDEFHQASPAELATPGTGLGLALARSFVELHHGRLEVESAPGQGSTFRLAIPQPVSRHASGPVLSDSPASNPPFSA
jgi:signal transduction histidine kinase